MDVTKKSKEEDANKRGQEWGNEVSSMDRRDPATGRWTTPDAVEEPMDLPIPVPCSNRLSRESTQDRLVKLSDDDRRD